MADERTPALIERLFWATYRGADRYRLNPAQWAALRFFADAQVSRKTSSEFAKYHQTTRGTANQTVLALIRKGYLRRDISPMDHRSKTVSLTVEGFRALESDPSRLLCRALDRMGPDARAKLDDQLAFLYESLRVLQSGRAPEARA